MSLHNGRKKTAMRSLILFALLVLPMSAGCGQSHSRAMNDNGTYTMDEASNSPKEASSPTDPQHDITLDQIRKHVQDHTAVVVDARSAEYYARGHIRGAINLPAGAMKGNFPKFKQDVASDQFIIIYCASSTCGAGDMAAEYLTGQGYNNVRVYKPGWERLSREKSLQ
jgi:rhodanese-related sulfurtransferase